MEKAQRDVTRRKSDHVVEPETAFWICVVGTCNGARTRGLWSRPQGPLVVYGYEKERMY